MIEIDKRVTDDSHLANQASDIDTINNDNEEAPLIAIIIPLNIGRILFWPCAGRHHPKGFARS